MSAAAKKVLFVCTANVCRSPMAEALFNDLAAERDLSLEAQSAGVRARPGYEMAPRAREALEEIGVLPGEHSSRRVSKEMLEGADLVLTMEPSQRDEIRLMESLGGRVWTLVEYAGGSPDDLVPDPYGLTLFAYRAAVRQIFGHVEKVLERLG